MDLLAQLDPVAIWKPHVQDAKVELELFGEFQRLRARSSRSDNIAKVAQRCRDQQSNVRLIIDMKNVAFCSVVFLSSHFDQKLCIFIQTAPVANAWHSLKWNACGLGAPSSIVRSTSRQWQFRQWCQARRR